MIPSRFSEGGTVKIIAYPKNMLPGVDYAIFDDDGYAFGNSLVDLEYETLSSLSDFIEDLKSIFIRERMVQLPETMVSHLCAYLGFFAMSGLKKYQVEKLETDICLLIHEQAGKVYKKFLKYQIKKTEGPNHNLQAMRDDSPGSIVAQTMRLGRVIWDTMEDLEFECGINRQTEWFCPQEDFLQLLATKAKKEIKKWKELISEKPVLYAVNQISIQIAWVMGYFAYLDEKEPTRYLEFGLPLIKMYGEAGRKLRIKK